MDKSAYEALFKALKDKDNKKRLGAARALGLIGIPSSINPLMEASEDDDENVSYAVQGALRRTLGELEKLKEVKCIVDVSIINKHNIPEKIPEYRI